MASNIVLQKAHHLNSVSEERQTLPLLAWLLPQLISLALSAGQIRFSYRWIDPPQKWAVEQLLVVQICAGLFLMRSFANAVFCIIGFGAGCVMLSLGQLLAVGSTNLLCAISSLGLWLAAMFALGADRHWQWIRAALTLWIFGGVLIAYAAMEFGGEKWMPHYSPLTLAIEQCHAQNHKITDWLMLICLTVFALARFSFRTRPLPDS